MEENNIAHFLKKILNDEIKKENKTRKKKTHINFSNP